MVLGLCSLCAFLYRRDAEYAEKAQRRNSKGRNSKMPTYIALLKDW
jgi:hypothetical protein